MWHGKRRKNWPGRKSSETKGRFQAEVEELSEINHRNPRAEAGKYYNQT
jgi:hypothetical protein